MFNFIDNLYYRFYRFISSLSEESIPRYNAVLLMSILSILNFFSIVSLLMIITNKIFIVNLPGPYLFAIGLLIIVANAYRVFGGKRYLTIEEKYEKESRKSKTINSLIAITYVILTILFQVLTLMYLNNHPIING